jgi:hypothetical protein
MISRADQHRGFERLPAKTSAVLGNGENQTEKRNRDQAKFDGSAFCRRTKRRTRRDGNSRQTQAETCCVLVA